MQFLIENVQSLHVMAMTLLFVYVIFVIKRLRHHRAFKWNLLFLLAFIAFTFRVLIGAKWQTLAHFFNTLEYFIPVFFMLAVQANFDDDFRFGRVEWLVSGVLCVLLLMFLLGKPMVVDADRPLIKIHLTFQYGIVGFCIFWAYWKILKTWENDLVLLRRRARTFFVFLIGPAILLGVILYYISLFEVGMVPFINLFVSSGIVITTFLSFAVFDLNFSDDPGYVSESLETISVVGDEQTPKIGLQQKEYENLLERLTRVMEQDRRFIENDLNVAKLAAYVDLPEYKLRTLINRVLGFKNFNQYLNKYRIDAAKHALDDPENLEPILNISLDCGYFNQSTFHKAFKDNTQLTPAEYRNRDKKL